MVDAVGELVGCQTTLGAVWYLYRRIAWRDTPPPPLDGWVLQKRPCSWYIRLPCTMCLRVMWREVAFLCVRRRAGCFVPHVVLLLLQA